MGSAGKNILVVGELCSDVSVYGEVDRISPEAPVPIIKVTRETSSDGMAGNVVGNLKSLWPEHNITFYHNEDRIVKRRYIDSKSNYMLMRADINDRVSRAATILDFENIVGDREFDAVVISDYDKGFLSESFISFLGDRFKCVKFLDTKKNIGLWARKIDFIKINEKEYQSNIEGGVNLALTNHLIVTLGSRGAKYYEKTGAKRHFDVPQVAFPDVSGAGDTFLSALVVHYLNTFDIPCSIVYANRCANKAVSLKGVVQVKREWM